MMQRWPLTGEGNSACNRLADSALANLIRAPKQERSRSDGIGRLSTLFLNQRPPLLLHLTATSQIPLGERGLSTSYRGKSIEPPACTCGTA